MSLLLSCGPVMSCRIENWKEKTSGGVQLAGWMFLCLKSRFKQNLSGKLKWPWASCPELYHLVNANVDLGLDLKKKYSVPEK